MEPQGQSSEKPQQVTLAAMEEEGNGDRRKGRRTDMKCRTGGLEQGSWERHRIRGKAVVPLQKPPPNSSVCSI